MANLTIGLQDVITPQTCSVLIAKIIKYVAYNAKQIPFNYETLRHTLQMHLERHNSSSESKDESKQVLSLKERKAYCFLEQIATVFDDFEFIFKSLEEELFSCGDMKEVMLMVGPTFLIPEHVLRIKIPVLAIGHSNEQHNVHKNILALHRKLLQCRELGDSLFKTNGPTNMYVLLGMPPETNGPQSNWFHRIEDVTISEKVPQSIIVLKNPNDINCNCIVTGNKFEDSCKVSSVESCVWYKAVKILRGFKNYKIDGDSAVNIIQSLPLMDNQD